MEAQEADSRARESGLSRKELEQSGTVTQRQNLDKQLRQSIEVTKPKLVDHSVEWVLVTGQRPKVDPLVRRSSDLS